MTPTGGLLPECELRQVLKGLFYLLKTGCQWRMLPREFGKWNGVYAYFWSWRQEGVWAKLREAVRKGERRRQERQAETLGLRNLSTASKV